MKKFLPLVLVLILGAFLRLWQISAVPNGLTWDEAAIGYNAYSILKTGRDEHGAFLPVIFKSFGDYKPGAYIYLTVPSIALFGLSEFAVRFPSAIFGILGILGIYLLVNILLPPPKSTIYDLRSTAAATAAALSPWLVHFSHGAWETNVFVTLLLFGIYYFLRFVQNKSTIFPTLFFACFSLAMYQGAKLLVPLVYLLLITIYFKDISWSFLKNFKTVPFVVFGLWIYFGALFGSAGNRLARLSIFTYKPNIVSDNNLFHNQTLLSTNLVISRYLWHFSPEVLLYEGKIISERAHVPGAGLLNPLEFIFLISGFIYLVKYLSSKSKILLLGLLLLAPIPGSLTLSEFSPVRSLFMAYPLAIISGLGIYYLFSSSKVIFAFCAVGYSLATLYIFDLYFFHSQTVFATEFNYGYKEAVQLIKDNPTSKVIFTDVYGQPYIYYLFYTKYDPATYQKENNFISGGLDVGKVERVGNVRFQQFGQSELSLEKDTLFVGTEGNINRDFDIAGDGVKLFRQIETPDKKIIFRVVKISKP